MKPKHLRFRSCSELQLRTEDPVKTVTEVKHPKQESTREVKKRARRVEWELLEEDIQRVE